MLITSDEYLGLSSHILQKCPPPTTQTFAPPLPADTVANARSSCACPATCKKPVTLPFEAKRNEN